MVKGVLSVKVAIVATVLLAASQVAVQTQINPFTAVDGMQGGLGVGKSGVQWAKLPNGRKVGSPAGLWIDKDGESLWAALRCGDGTTPIGSQTDCDNSPDMDPIILFDKDGNVKTSFGKGLFSWPHGLTQDRDGNIWVAEARAPKPVPGKKVIGHQVLKFSPEGKLLLALGEAGVPGKDNAHFQNPADVVVAPDGTVYIADGHDANGNNRVMMFTIDGKFIKSFGETGYGPGQMHIMHAIARDPETGNIYVASRGNQRLEVFDKDGKYLNKWTQFGMPSDVVFDAEGRIYVADSESDKRENPGWRTGIRIGRTKSAFVEWFIPDPNNNPAFDGHGSGAESLAVDKNGNIYAGEPRPQRLQKYLKVF